MAGIPRDSVQFGMTRVRIQVKIKFYTISSGSERHPEISFDLLNSLDTVSSLPG